MRPTRSLLAAGAATPVMAGIRDVRRGSDPSNHIFLTGGTLPLPGGVAVASNGTVYAAGLTAFPPTGFVARLSSH